MRIIDKNNTLANIGNKEYVSIELGCGNRKKNASAIGVDMLDYDCVDIVGDALDVLMAIPSESVDLISSNHFLEHVDDVDLLIGQISRVLKSDGCLVSVVPHFSNPFFYSDPTHKRYFGLYTFGYYAHTSMFKRTLPVYSKQNELVITDIELVFKSYPPRYIRHAIKRFIGIIVNSCGFIKEFYEENLTWIIPCYEVRCVIKKREANDSKGAVKL